MSKRYFAKRQAARKRAQRVDNTLLAIEGVAGVITIVSTAVGVTAAFKERRDNTAPARAEAKAARSAAKADAKARKAYDKAQEKRIEAAALAAAADMELKLAADQLNGTTAAPAPKAA